MKLYFKKIIKFILVKGFKSSYVMNYINIIFTSHNTLVEIPKFYKGHKQEVDIPPPHPHPVNASKASRDLVRT